MAVLNFIDVQGNEQVISTNVRCNTCAALVLLSNNSRVWSIKKFIKHDLQI